MSMSEGDLPQVAVESMNTTHKNEVRIIADLLQLIERHKDGEELGGALGEAVERLAAHVEEHFSSEEALMQQTGFPAYGVHKGEHDRVRLYLGEKLEAFRARGDIGPLADYLVKEHPQWAFNHIATMDTMTAYFIAQQRGEAS